MPTEHKKSSKAKPNVEIKVEGGQDVHPLGHYIDDRVELIRQIFMSLKSKTIKSIAPDFLQGKSLETIQEYCLDELLGISKKRLQSIINATKCPDNTESSDSDVENIEEHISLEEISSDSADDALRAKKPKGIAKAAAANKNGTASGTGSGKKEISVLELLELQARARAIRSQLALEPVTKIELDSDNDSGDSSSTKLVKNSTSAAAGSSNDNKAKPPTKNVVEEANGMQIIMPTVPAVKPVRLKRNFRQRQNSDYDPDEDDETKSVNSVDNSETKEADQKPIDEKEEKVEKHVDVAKPDEEKREESERSPSPDLIPIIQEPETYCISSDSDEPGSSSVPKYITYPTVVREKLPETEDEIFLKKIKEGSGADLRDLIKARRSEKKSESSETLITSNDAIQGRTEATNQQETSSKNLDNSIEESLGDKKEEQLEKEDTEPEEGELTDGDDQEELNTNEITILSSDDEIEDKSKRSEAVAEELPVVSECKKDESSSESSSSSDNDSDTDSSDAPNPPIFKEADDDDDIIDLGDEELDFEMKEMERSDTRTKKLKKTKKKVKNADKPNVAVSENVEEVKVDEKTDDNHEASQSIETTESTENNDESKDTSKEEESTVSADVEENDTWQTRWLRGRNVTKVMATSRLANKVRTKIKQKKSKLEQETSNPNSNDVPSTEPVAIDPSVEEGSVQHYEVLLAQETDKKNEE